MQCRMAVTVARQQFAEQCGYTGRLIDGELFFYRQMQRKMQEGVGLAAIRRPFTLKRAFRRINQRVVFGV